MAILACAFVAAVCGLAVSGSLPTAVPVLYVAASVLGFVLYRLDKGAAIRGSRRTPEDTLLVVGLIGGWPGALVAQRVLRHKYSKTSFQVLFWTSVALNSTVLAAFWWLYRTP